MKKTEYRIKPWLTAFVYCSQLVYWVLLVQYCCVVLYPTEDQATEAGTCVWAGTLLHPGSWRGSWRRAYVQKTQMIHSTYVCCSIPLRQLQWVWKWNISAKHGKTWRKLVLRNGRANFALHVPRRRPMKWHLLHHEGAEVKEEGVLIGFELTNQTSRTNAPIMNIAAAYSWRCLEI